MAVTIGSTIRMLRLRDGMTQDALAERLHVTRQAVSNYERGKTNPDVDQLTQIADIFHMDLEDLIYGRIRSFDRKKRLTTSIIILLCLMLILAVSVPLAARSRKESLRLGEISWFWMFTTCVLIPLLIAGVTWCAACSVLLLSAGRVRLPRSVRVIKWVLLGLFIVFLSSNLHIVLITAMEKGWGPQWLYALSINTYMISTRHAALMYPLPILIGLISAVDQYARWMDQ